MFMLFFKWNCENCKTIAIAHQGFNQSQQNTQKHVGVHSTRMTFPKAPINISHWLLNPEGLGWDFMVNECLFPRVVISHNKVLAWHQSIPFLDILIINLAWGQTTGSNMQTATHLLRICKIHFSSNIYRWLQYIIYVTFQNISRKHTRQLWDNSQSGHYSVHYDLLNHCKVT